MARVVSPACSTTVPLVGSLQSMDISYILGYTKDIDCSNGMFISWPMMKARWSKGIWRTERTERTKRTKRNIRISDGVKFPYVQRITSYRVSPSQRRRFDHGHDVQRQQGHVGGQITGRLLLLVGAATVGGIGLPPPSDNVGALPVPRNGSIGYVSKTSIQNRPKSYKQSKQYPDNIQTISKPSKPSKPPKPSKPFKSSTSMHVYTLNRALSSTTNVYQHVSASSYLINFCRPLPKPLVRAV